MISQLLFGELVEVLESKGKQWLKVRCAEDNFVGWVASNQLKPITPSEFDAYQENFAFVLDLFHPVMNEESFLPLSLGARLPLFDGLRFSLGEENYTFSGQAVFPNDIAPSSDLIIKLAKRFLNAPFLWGGRSAMGLDSAGLVQVVYRIAGFPLPREAFQQVLQGGLVDFVEQAQPGDLAFFENQQGRISHVGILIPDGRIIHVSGKARVDRIDHFGIFNEEKQRYTHRLRIVKRILNGMTAGMPEKGQKTGVIHQQFELF